MSIKASDIFFAHEIQGGRRILVRQKGKPAFCVCDNPMRAAFLVALLNNNLDKLKKMEEIW